MRTMGGDPNVFTQAALPWRLSCFRNRRRSDLLMLVQSTLFSSISAVGSGRTTEVFPDDAAGGVDAVDLAESLDSTLVSEELSA